MALPSWLLYLLALPSCSWPIFLYLPSHGHITLPSFKPSLCLLYLRCFFNLYFVCSSFTLLWTKSRFKKRRMNSIHQRRSTKTVRGADHDFRAI